MLFNTLIFAAFFIIVYTLFLMFQHRGQNRVLLAASYVFYAMWDWRFCSLILISTMVDYTCGLKIFESKEKSRKRLFLFISVAANIGLLCFFKYYNFFVGSLQDLFVLIGLPAELRHLDIILPMGISFYTFQTMSYTIDIYRDEFKPTRNFWDFALFVSFFPQLVAGPIERAKHLLPQVMYPRKLDWLQIKEGVYLICWGLFQKSFIADNLSKLVDPVYSAEGGFTGSAVLLATYAFAFQIFCDFAGYSNMARGLAKCLGFDIMFNFNIPYISKNPQEFWRRWHISLSSWFRDYCYISLGGNRLGKVLTLRNLIITMFLAGLWHGAAWTFVLWGLFHGVLLVIYRFVWPHEKGSNFWSNALQCIVFFHLVCLGWILFRATNIDQAWLMMKSLIFNFGFDAQTMWVTGKTLLFYIWFLLVVQIFQARANDLLIVLKSSRWIKAGFYGLILYSLFAWGEFGGEEFIYFVF